MNYGPKPATASSPTGLRPAGSDVGRCRHSQQRQVILEELRAVNSHPTAVELHELVRRRLPKVSLGTVYRNLDLLGKMGLIEKLEHASGEARFDANITAHDHLRCVRCGRIDDVMSPPLAITPPDDHHLYGYEVIGHRLEFIGICPRCRQSTETGPCSSASNTSGSPTTNPGESKHA